MTTNNLLPKLNPAFREGIIIIAVAFFIAIAFNSIRSNNISLCGFPFAALIKNQQANIPSITLSETYDLYRKNNIIFLDACDSFSFLHVFFVLIYDRGWRYFF
jgi:hypothetical protein